ncbi:MAG: hypothetical protein QM760_14460 [Nibricoccus sp.]
MSPKPTPAQKKALLIKLALVCVAGLVGGFLILRGLDVRGLLDDAVKLVREVGAPAFFAVMAFLPAFGMPLSPFWLSAAPVFAPVLGLPLVIALCSVSLAINLTITYWLARYTFRPMLVWLVQRLGYSLPKVAEADRVSVAVLVRVTPGPPFCVQGYLLGLAEIPYRMYMLVSWPISMAYGIAFIYFGDSLAQGKGKLALLSLCGVVALIVGFKFLRRRMLAKQKAVNVEPTAEAAQPVEKFP